MWPSGVFLCVIYDNFKLCGRLESIYLYLFLESVFTQSHPIQLKLFPRLITHWFELFIGNGTPDVMTLNRFNSKGKNEKFHE